MSAQPREEPEPSERDLFEQRFVSQMSDQGRAVRVVLAFFFGLISLIPVTFVAWGYGLVFSGPAVVLLFYAGMDRRKRLVVLVWSVPAVVGLGLGLFSVVAYASRYDTAWDFLLPLLGVASLTALAAVWLGRPRSAR